MLHCSELKVMQCYTVHCCVVFIIAVHYFVLKCNAVYCDVLQYIAAENVQYMLSTYCVVCEVRIFTSEHIPRSCFCSICSMYSLNNQQHVVNSSTHREICKCSQQKRFVKKLVLVLRGFQRYASVNSTIQCLQNLFVKSTNVFVQHEVIFS